MSGDQVLRVLILKQMKSFSYEELHFHLMDSGTYRTFSRFGDGEGARSQHAGGEH